MTYDCRNSLLHNYKYADSAVPQVAILLRATLPCRQNSDCRPAEETRLLGSFEPFRHHNATIRDFYRFARQPSALQEQLDINAKGRVPLCATGMQRLQSWKENNERWQAAGISTPAGLGKKPFCNRLPRSTLQNRHALMVPMLFCKCKRSFVVPVAQIRIGAFFNQIPSNSPARFRSPVCTARIRRF